MTSLCWMALLLASSPLRAGEDAEIWDKDAGAGSWTDTFSNGDVLDSGINQNIDGYLESAVDHKGRVYYAWGQQDGTNRRTWIGRWVDGIGAQLWDEGTSAWTTTLSSGDPVPNYGSVYNGQPQVAVDSQDRVYFAISPNAVLHLMRWDGTNLVEWDTGAPGWTTTLTNGDAVHAIQYGSGGPGYSKILVDSSDRVYIPHGVSDGTRTRLCLGRYDGTSVTVWDNGGSSWTTTYSSGDPIDSANGATFGNGAYDDDAAIDSAGKVYIAYAMYDGTNSRLHLTRYDGTDVKIWDHGGAAWTDTFSNGDPIDVSASGTIRYVHAEVDSQDRVYIAHAKYNGTAHRLYLHRYDGTDVVIWDTGAPGWTTTISSGDPIDRGNYDIQGIHLAVDSADRAYVAFIQGVGQYELHLDRYDGTSVKAWDNGASSWTETLSSGDRIDNQSYYVGYFDKTFDMKIDSQDRVYIGYSQQTLPSGANHDLHLTRYDGTDVKIWDNGASSWTDTFSNGDPIGSGTSTTLDIASVEMAIDAADRVYLPHANQNGTKFHIYLSRYRPAEAATYDARVSVYQDGGDPTARTLTTPRGVWNYAGATFATDRPLTWVREAPYDSSGSYDLGAVAICRSNPAYALAAGENREIWAWKGTSWTRDTLPGTGTAVPYDIDFVTTDFAVVAGATASVWRWTGTTWLFEKLKSANDILQVDMISTTFGIAGGFGTFRWTGTTWLLDHPSPTTFSGGAAAVATDLAWTWHRLSGFPVGVYRWGGTSWTLFTTLSASSNPYHLTTIHGERDFALGIDIGSTSVPSIYRWTGTSWVTDMYGRSLSKAVAVRTDWAWVVGGSGYVARWTGTSWVDYGPLTGTDFSFYDVAAVDTDFALACGLSSAPTESAIWVWRGTSWLHWRTEQGPSTVNTFGTQGRRSPLATAGETLSFVAGNKRELWKRQMAYVVDDAGTVYRTVVQVTPKGSMWTWAGTSDTQSYFGVANLGGASTREFQDINGTGSTRSLILYDYDSDLQEDVFVWVDTVGGWNGASSTHNNNSATGIGLTLSGGVDESPSGPDAFGETDQRLSCSDGGTTAWTAVAGNTGAGTGTVIRDDALTWEYWFNVNTGWTESQVMETYLRVAPGAFGTELSGLRWSMTLPKIKLRTGAWRWCRDNASTPQVIKPVNEPLSDVATTGEKLRLRIREDEVNGGASSTNGAFTLWYSTDQATWTQLTTSSSVWKLFDGQASGVLVLTSPILPGNSGATYWVNIESTSVSTNFSPYRRLEVDVSVQSSGAVADTTYYFELRQGGRRCLPTPGVGYPSVRTTADTTFNYLYSEASKGPFGRPVRNLQTISGGNGEAFKVAYVTTQSGSSDKVYAVSRTDGAIARSYTASGTLDYPLIYWDSTNTRYNLFFVQSGYRILALTDNGTTITANTAWAADGLKSFGNSTADPISEPVRIFDSDRQNYLYFFVTSYQNNTSTLYKVRASDGTVVTGGNYSAKAQTIGVNTGLVRTIPPLYVDGTVYGIDTTPPVEFTSLPKVFKIPSSGGTSSWVNTFTEYTVSPTYPIWYTRNSLSSGPRILPMATYVFRVDISSMTSAGEWPGSDEGGQGLQSGNPCTGAVSPSFGSSYVPVFLGGKAWSTIPSRIHRISGSTGADETNFPYSLTGDISSVIQINGNWLYFGTDKGYIYGISATDPTQSAGTRFRVPGDSPVVGVHVDATRSVVYFTTADGRVYQFDTR